MLGYIHSIQKNFIEKYNYWTHKFSHTSITIEEEKKTTLTQIDSNIKLGVLSPVDFNPPTHPVHLKPPAFIQHMYTYDYTDKTKFFT